MSLYDNLEFFSLVGFRDIYKRFIYIHCRELLDEMFPGELDDSTNGLIAYCYIDRDEGLSFYPVLLAAVETEALQVFELPHADNTTYILRLRNGTGKMSELHDEDAHMYLYGVDPNKYEFFDLSLVDFDIEVFAGIKERIDTTYDAGEAVEELRSDKYLCLDNYRNALFPDDVQVLLISEENGIEKVWVRLTFDSETNGIFGELLNEPYKDFGCHKGDLIGIKEIQSEDNKFLVFNGLTAEINE